jgi:hypothetical protein
MNPALTLARLNRIEEIPSSKAKWPKLKAIGKLAESLCPIEVVDGSVSNITILGHKVEDAFTYLTRKALRQRSSARNGREVDRSKHKNTRSASDRRESKLLSDFPSFLSVSSWD